VYVIQIVGRVGGEVGEEDGLYVSFFDPEGVRGEAVMWLTPKLENAKQFSSREEINNLHRNSELKKFNISILSLVSASMSRTFSRR
jgi:hypothetical protein